MGHVVITSGYIVALEEPRKAFVLSISRGILFVLLSLFVCTTLFKGKWKFGQFVPSLKSSV